MMFILLIFLFERCGQVTALDKRIENEHTISHLFPSKTNLGGLLPANAAGFAGRAGFFPAAMDISVNPVYVELRMILYIPGGVGEPGTVCPALNDGFLCVISLLSTFLRPLVTSSPRLSSANTAATPPAGGALGGAVSAGGGTSAGTLNSSTVGP